MVDKAQYVRWPRAAIKKSQSEKCQKYKSQSEKCQQKKSQSCLGAYDKVSLSFEPISFMPSAISAFDI